MLKLILNFGLRTNLISPKTSVFIKCAISLRQSQRNCLEIKSTHPKQGECRKFCGCDFHSTNMFEFPKRLHFFYKKLREIWRTPVSKKRGLKFSVSKQYSNISGFTFSIWSIIYLWLSVSLLALVISIFAKTKDGRF